MDADEWAVQIAMWVQTMVAAGLAAATIGRRIAALNMLSRALDVAPASTTRQMIERWLAGLTAPRTRRAYHSDVCLFFRWFADQYELPDPTVKIPRPRAPRALPRPIEMGALHAAVDAAPERLGTWMLAGALAGLRVGEIARLHSDDIDDGVLVVREGKGAKDRAVPVHPVLGARLEQLGYGWIAPGPDGHLSPEWVSRRITRHLHASGIKATAHALRHTFGTETARASGGDVSRVAALMGHASTATTMGYVAVSAARLRDLVNDLEWAS